MLKNYVYFYNKLFVELNKKRNNLSKLVIEMASIMFSMYNKSDISFSREKVFEVLENGSAYKKFLDYVTYMGGNLDFSIDNYLNVYSKNNGYISDINSLIIGMESMKCGAGRLKKEDEINYDAGIVLLKEVDQFFLPPEL